MTYEKMISVVESAGFFTAYDSDLRRVICAAPRRPHGGLSENSFWIAQRSGEWFLGMWGPHHYRIPDEERVAGLCTALLQRQPYATAADIDNPIRQEFQLIEIDDLPED